MLKSDLFPFAWIGRLAWGWRIALGLTLTLSLVTRLLSPPVGAVEPDNSQDCLPANPSLSTDSSGNGTVPCCQASLLRSAFLDAPKQVLPVLCQLLRLPTDSRSEGDLFRRLVVPDSIVRNSSPSAETMTWPSLWWNQDSIPEQLGGRRLVDAWVTYRLQGSPIQVMDVMVNSQFWQKLTLPERYGVLQAFGDTAQQLGYQLRFFESNGYTAHFLGLYACFSSSSPLGVSCQASLDTIRLGQLQQGPLPENLVGPDKP